MIFFNIKVAITQKQFISGCSYSFFFLLLESESLPEVLLAIYIYIEVLKIITLKI